MSVRTNPREAAEEEAQQATEEAKRQLEAASKAQDAAATEATQAAALARHGVTEKLRATYRRQLQLHMQRTESVVRGLWQRAEETMINSQEARARADDTFALPAVLLPMRKRDSLLELSSWADAVPTSAPIVAFFDLMFNNSWGHEELAAALRLVGSAGCVMIMGSAQNLSESCTLQAKEQSMLKMIDPHQTTIVRVFMAWSPGSGLVGWLTFICNHAAVDAAKEDGGGLLRKVLSSTALKNGIIGGLPVLPAEECSKDKDFRVLLPAQRGAACYEMIFQSLDITLGSKGCCCILEADAGVGDLMQVVLGKLDSSDDAPTTTTRWIGSISPQADARSNSARHRHVQTMLDEATKTSIRHARKLRRRESRSHSALAEIAAKLPACPDQSEMLVSALRNLTISRAGIPATLAGTTTITECFELGHVEDTRAKRPEPASTATDAQPPLLEPMPHELKLSHMCINQKVLIGRSEHYACRRGLYPGQKFLKDDIILYGTGAWFTEAELSAATQSGGDHP